MNEKNSQAPLNCGCRCGCPLNDDPKQVREKVVDRVKVIMNISCFESAYGKEPTNSADVVGRILALLSLNDPEFEAQLRGSDQAELEEQLMSLERLSSWGKS